MLQDTISICGGYAQTITDWYNGDDRIFTGSVAGLPQTDPNLTDCYFTLKLNPSDTDANSIIQKHITTFLDQAGQITADPNSFDNIVLLVHVYSAEYEGLVQPGTVYYWDFRVITAGGSTWTIATGTVQFQEQVTQTNLAGTPAAMPNNGQPVFRGFTALNPDYRIGSVGQFNPGDIYFNSNPGAGQPVGWQCTQQGSPGAWQPFYTGGLGIPVTGVLPPAAWTFGTQPPTSGGHAEAEIVWNLLPQFGGNIGWVCVTAGFPGVWAPFGIISLP